MCVMSMRWVTRSWEMLKKMQDLGHVKLFGCNALNLGVINFRLRYSPNSCVILSLPVSLLPPIFEAI
jgi:hypothetical protein